MSAPTALAVLAAPDVNLVSPVAPGLQLICAALAGIAVIVALILWLKVHPFIALILGSFTVGLVAWQNVSHVLNSFLTSFGSTASGVGLLIALGAMFAKLLADSGGADEIVDTIIGRSSVKALPSLSAGAPASPASRSAARWRPRCRRSPASCSSSPRAAASSRS
jgi:GntP family gluconate:H+ symporter